MIPDYSPLPDDAADSLWRVYRRPGNPPAANLVLIAAPLDVGVFTAAFGVLAKMSLFKARYGLSPDGALRILFITEGAPGPHPSMLPPMQLTVSPQFEGVIRNGKLNWEALERSLKRHQPEMLWIAPPVVRLENLKWLRPLLKNHHCGAIILRAPEGETERRGCRRAGSGHPEERAEVGHSDGCAAGF